MDPNLKTTNITATHLHLESHLPTLLPPDDHVFACIGAGTLAVLCMNTFDFLKLKFQFRHPTEGGLVHNHCTDSVAGCRIPKTCLVLSDMCAVQFHTLHAVQHIVTCTDQRGSQSASPAPDIFELMKGGKEEGSAQADAQEQMKREGAREQVSAADYDRSLDRQEDEQRQVRGAHDELIQDVEMIGEEEGDDDNVDNIFAVSVVDKKKVKKVKKVVKPSLRALIMTMLDDAADSEGYYQVILGEQLDGGRYQVFSSIGKGMFARA
ncbi:hypothetical protein V8E53_005967 [Lactarius tabidus]